MTTSCVQRHEAPWVLHVLLHPWVLCGKCHGRLVIYLIMQGGQPGLESFKDPAQASELVHGGLGILPSLTS